MTPEELIAELGPGTDGAVCVQRLVDNQAVLTPTRHGPTVGAAHEDAHDTGVREKKDDDDDKDEKAPHTPYRNTKRG